jgi:hypothetical protein
MYIFCKLDRVGSAATYKTDQTDQWLTKLKYQQYIITPDKAIPVIQLVTAFPNCSKTVLK